MSFNPDISKQAQEVIFLRKSFVKASHPVVFFNDIPVARRSTHKKLNFDHHIIKKSQKPAKV